MKFSTFFGLATMVTSAFALPAVQEDTSVAPRADLISTLTTEVDAVLDLVADITTDLDKAISEGNVIQIVPELTHQLLSVNGTLATVVGTLTELQLTGSVVDLVTLLKFGVGAVATVVKVLTTLVHTLTTLISKLLSIPALSKELATIIDTTLTQTPTALAKVLQDVINFVSVLNGVLGKVTKA